MAEEEKVQEGQEVHKRVEVTEKGTSQKSNSDINLGILLVLAILFFPAALIYVLVLESRK